MGSSSPISFIFTNVLRMALTKKVAKNEKGRQVAKNESDYDFLQQISAKYLKYNLL